MTQPFEFEATDTLEDLRRKIDQYVDATFDAATRQNEISMKDCSDEDKAAVQAMNLESKNKMRWDLYGAAYDLVGGK